MTPSLILMQGIPGSGKSRAAKRLAKRIGALVVSADDYPPLYVEGRRQDEFLGAAHRECFRKTIDRLAFQGSVVVDNTNLSALELAPYVLLGGAYGVEVEIVRMKCPQPVAYRRQLHGVPLAPHRKMAQRLKAFQAPSYWDVKIREVDGS